MTPKVLGLVSSCNACPNFAHDSGGRYRCRLVDQIVENAHVVASFCPLANFPSDKIAELERTLSALQNPFQHGFIYMVMAHTAKKLGVVFNGIGSALKITTQKGETVLLIHDHIREITLNPTALQFSHNGTLYKLHPDALPPTLLRKSPPRPDIPDLPEELWIQVPLQHRSV